MQKAFATENALTYVPILAAPNAACRLAFPGHAAQGDPIYADDQGILHLQLMTEGVAGEHQRLGVDCQGDDGATFHNDFELEITRGPVEQVQPRPGKFATKSLIRPALVDDLSFTPAELIERGYPPRPDPSKRPEAYQRWRERVAKPARFVEPKGVDLDRVNGNFLSTSLSNIWSGATTLGNGGWLDVEAEWIVPSVQPPWSDCDIYPLAWSSAWVGIGGWGIQSLIQDGTEMDAMCYWNAAHTQRFFLGSYYTWTEVLPAAASSFTNIGVRAGDSIYATTWVGDSHGNTNANGGYAWFFISNDTMGTYSQRRTAIPSSNPFVGGSAEWIVERPTINGTPATNLSRYGSLYFTNAFADSATITSATPWNPGSIHVVMFTNKVLSHAIADANNNLGCAWSAYR